MKVYFIQPKRDVSPPYPRVWWESMAYDKTVSCGAGCAGVVPDLCPTPIDVPFETSTEETIIGCVLVQILSRRLYEILEPHLDNVVVGRCVRAEDGVVIPSHVTVYCTPGEGLYFDGRVPSQTRYHVCKSCGVRYAHYCAAGYAVHRADLKERRAWLEGRHGAPVVDKELAEQVRALKLPNTHFVSMPVVD